MPCSVFRFDPHRPVSNSSFFLAAAIINRIWPLDLFHMNAQHVSQWIEYHRLIGIEKFYWCDNWSSPEESTRPILEVGGGREARRGVQQCNQPVSVLTLCCRNTSTPAS